MNESREALAETAARAAAALLSDLEGVAAALIATSDGFALAHAGQLPLDPARLAAMVSSLAALGDVAALEARMGDTRCLLVEAGAGRIVVRRLQVRGTELAAVLLTDKRVLLGMAWNRLSQVEAELNTR